MVKSNKNVVPAKSPNIENDAENKPDKEPDNAEILEVKSNKTITITLQYYKNMIGMFNISDLRTRFNYKDNDLGESDSIPITDDDELIINSSFCFEIDNNSLKDLNALLSNPGILYVYQHPGVFDQSIYDQLEPMENMNDVIPKTKSFNSIVSIYEAFTGNKLDYTNVRSEKKIQRVKSEPVSERKKEKPKVEKKERKKKKSFKSSLKKINSSIGSNKSSSSIESGVQLTLCGICIIDFIPLFYGKTSYTEALLIKPTKDFQDDRMNTCKNHPQIVVTVSVDKALHIEDNLMVNFTVESIFNLPPIMKADMEYRMYVVLPVCNVIKERFLFMNPIYTTSAQEESFKCWPGMPRMGKNANTTKYKISTNNEEIISKFEDDAELVSLMKEENPRLEFNMLRRYLMSRESMTEFMANLKKYRNIVVEILATPKLRKGQLSCPWDNEEGLSTKRSKALPNWHFTALLDVSGLLYPGVTRIRVACQLRTYNPDELRKCSGLNEEYFVAQPKKELKEPKEIIQKEDTDTKKGKKKSKDKSSTSRASTVQINKPTKEEVESDFAKPLPGKPEELLEAEPSSPLFSEDGRPCFIVVEIELSQPIVKKRAIEDLSNDLQELLLTRETRQPKVVLTNCLVKDYYKEVLAEIMKDLNEQYQLFLTGNRQMKNEISSDFIKYIKSVGAYQTYLSSITRAASMIVSNKFKIDAVTEKSNLKEYNDLVAEVFVYLVSEMNDFVNKLLYNGVEPINKVQTSADNLFLYAKEAVQIGNIKVADRYFLERIVEDQKNADFWFDYAVFQLEIADMDKAFECVQEALSHKSDHIYSLLMLGAFLANKEQKDEAETCFLNLMVHAPRWLEGWGVLYLFYQKYNAPEGMDIALEMAKKYIDDERKPTGMFEDFQDLLWNSQIIPNTVFFRTAMLLLKLRLYDWAEYACAEEFEKNYGLANYLISAICYYKGSYEHALQHIKEVKEYYGGDYAVYALAAHSLAALGKFEEAQVEYYHVLESFSRPTNVHLVNINLANILQKFGKDQEARKIILISCKHNPTPYTWMKAGVLYLQENDLLSAEECLSEGNIRDNRNAEIWGYLALTNSKLSRPFEAELCYNQALKNGLDDEELLKRIELESEKWNTGN